MTAQPAAATPQKARKVWLLFIVATIFGAVLVGPYLRLDVNTSRLDVDDEAHYALLVTHVFTALIALVLGPLQFIPAIRARRQTHRAIGRVYLLAGVLPSALTFLAVTSRILVPLLLLAQLPFTTGSVRDSAPSMIPIGQALGWIVNLIAAEILIRRRRQRSPSLPEM